MTTAQALESGLTWRQLRTLCGHGWGHPTRGIFISPDAPDAFRASVRGALLARPAGVVCQVSASRLWGLSGLTRWVPGEEPHLLLPAGCTYNRCSGIRLHSGLRSDERVLHGGFPVTILARTVTDMASALSGDELICFLDSALRLGWSPGGGLPRRLQAMLSMADGRSESAFETLLRLLLVRGGMAPEALQHKLFDIDGRVYARLDMAWPSVKLGIEADGREYHDLPAALYTDRRRANRLELAGWTILRFTWADLKRRPEKILAQVARALNPDRVARRAG